MFGIVSKHVDCLKVSIHEVHQHKLVMVINSTAIIKILREIARS